MPIGRLTDILVPPVSGRSMFIAATMRVDYPFGDRQTETGSPMFGGEESLERFRTDFFGYARALVGHRDGAKPVRVRDGDVDAPLPSIACAAFIKMFWSTTWSNSRSAVTVAEPLC